MDPWRPSRVKNLIRTLYRWWRSYSCLPWRTFRLRRKCPSLHRWGCRVCVDLASTLVCWSVEYWRTFHAPLFHRCRAGLRKNWTHGEPILLNETKNQHYYHHSCFYRLHTTLSSIYSNWKLDFLLKPHVNYYEFLQMYYQLEDSLFLINKINSNWQKYLDTRILPMQQLWFIKPVMLNGILGTVWDLRKWSFNCKGNSPSRGQVTGGRAIACNASSWRNMIRRDGIA